MKNKAQKFWDKQAKRFDDLENQDQPATRIIMARTKEYLHENDHVLDFGCATGTKTLELADKVKNIRGLDYSARMISEAIKKKNEANVTNVSFIQGTIFNDDLESASFDKIVAYSIIHLVDDSDKVIQRIHELLKPGGLFISETACFKEKMDWLTRFGFTVFRFMKLLGIFPLHLNMFKTSDVKQILTRSNFKIIETEELFSHGMTVSFIVAEKQ